MRMPRVIPYLTAIALCAWAPMLSAQVQWERYSGNPVLSPGASGSWDESVAIPNTVIFHEGVYKMWYEGGRGFGYATSADGLAWSKHESNPVLLPGAAGSWDDGEISQASVVYEEGLYRMWYTGSNGGDNRVGYATSPDGVVWTKYSGNPVLDLGPPGSMDDHEVMHPSVIFEAGLYRMWYNGKTNVIPQQILYASSPDGINWSRFTAHPMLEAGPSGSWDDGGLGALCVVVSGASYHMWYTGWSEYDPDLDPPGDFAFGHATSSDGLVWTKTTAFNPVLTPGTAGSWEDSLIWGPSVSLEGGGFRMWYAGTDGVLFQTGHATSLNVTGVPRDPSGSPVAVGPATLYQNEPNPFRASTTIRYHVVVPTSVRLEVIDLAGRRVRRLLSSDEVQAGVHALQWDGRDDTGRQLGVGLYFCRLVAPGVAQNRKMILAK